MAAQLDDLENDAVEARQELAERRSKYPSICSNILMKTVKCDIKTSMSFKVNIGNESNSISTKYGNKENLCKLNLTRDVTPSYEKLEELEERLNQVSKALALIRKNKTYASFPG